MNLFIFKDYNLSVANELYSIPVFKKLLGKYKNLNDAMLELKYIFFTTDYRSDFADIVDLTARQSKVLRDVIGNDQSRLKLNDITEEAIAFYDERQQTTSLHLLNDARFAIGKVRDFLRNVDLTLLDPNGKPIYDIKKLTDTIAATPKLVGALSELETRIKREMDEGSRIRGGGDKGFYED